MCSFLSKWGCGWPECVVSSDARFWLSVGVGQVYPNLSGKGSSGASSSGRLPLGSSGHLLKEGRPASGGQSGRLQAGLAEEPRPLDLVFLVDQLRLRFQHRSPGYRSLLRGPVLMIAGLVRSEQAVPPGACSSVGGGSPGRTGRGVRVHFLGNRVRFPEKGSKTLSGSLGC